MSKVELMMKIETSLLTIDMERSTSNLILFIRINGRVNQLRDNSTKTSVSMLIEPSSSFLDWDKADTSISSTTETWSSRLEMEERLKCGGSTKDL
jgi:hypothetical protein